jgi:alginate O-acetyltransferase complex protein AlgI
VSINSWLFGNLIDKAESPFNKKFYLLSGVAISLVFLGYFKYTGFLLNDVINPMMGGEREAIDIILPVGISFFTFQAMSYLIDIYRGTIHRCTDPYKYLLYIAFFPQLVAGPIVRSSQFLPQLRRITRISKRNLLLGSQLFVWGAFQKVFIADNLSFFVDKIYLEPALYSSLTIWIAVYAYALQIFCDFSGYSLMAIGISRILGITLPKNFDMPYNAFSIIDFWRRWHISLSSWLRDYLYISLGGNRGGVVRTQANMIITMLLGGLWHGASWNFVIWGGLQGVGLAINKAWTSLFDARTIKNIYLVWAYRLMAWLLTFHFVILLWVPFRSADFATTQLIFEKLFIQDYGFDWFHVQTLLLLAIGMLWHLAQLSINQLPKMVLIYSQNVGIAKILYLTFAIFVLLLFSTTESAPFIYFQF